MEKAELKMDDACVEETWRINDWIEKHKLIVAAGVSCYIEVGNPKIRLRFFLSPKEKLFPLQQSRTLTLDKWYCLCAEVLSEVNEIAVLKVIAKLYSPQSTLISTRDGVIPLYKSKGKVVDVIDYFISFESSNMQPQYVDFYLPTITSLSATSSSHQLAREITIAIKAELYRSTQNQKKIDPLDPNVEKSAEAEESLIRDLKNLYVAHKNYADIKLESKDHMTLDAHKFILAARSRYLQNSLDDAMNVENFNGTMNVNINGKPLVVILHWMYTGELHENSGNVMEELVDAAILFELTHLMKLLDKKLITICNKENMFRLYQVAQKNGMPNAMDDISAYIREQL